MSPSPGDETQSLQDTKTTGGLASVFKSLTGGGSGAKLTKTTPNSVSASNTSTNINLAEQLNDSRLSRGLPTNHMEAFEQLRAGSISERVAAAQQLRHAVIEYPLNPVLDIWYAAKDMIEPSNPSTTRNAGWELLTACVKHTSSTDLERKEYFQTVTALANPEDFHLQLMALVELTNHGRNLSGFEYDIFPLTTNWLVMKFESTRVARKQASRTKGKVVASGEDQNLADLFAYLMDLIKFNFGVMSDESAQGLLDALVKICMNTSNTDDLRACIGVMGAIVTYGAIPDVKLKDCVQVLSSIHCLVDELPKESWHTLGIFFKSHHGHAVVRILLDMLSCINEEVDKSKEETRNVRGALSVLQKLISKSAEKGYPPVAYGLLVEGLSNVANSAKAWKIHNDVLRLINVLFEGPKGYMNPMIVHEDWSSLFDVAHTCTRAYLNLPANEVKDDKESPNIVMGREVIKLIAHIETLLNAQSDDLLQRQSCISFFSKVNKVLPDTAATLVLDYFKEFRCCYPSDLEWEENLRLVLNVLFANRTRSSQLRIQALRVVTEVYDMVELVHDQLEPDFVPSLVRSILRDVAEESDIDVLRDIVSFTVGIASNAEHFLFHYIVDTLHGILTVNQLRPAISPIVTRPMPTSSSSEHSIEPQQTPSDVVAKGYVQIFLRVMHTDVMKSTRIFGLLVTLVKFNSTEIDARLTAMKLLFRLRADWANRLYITTFFETENLAATLYRTDSSMAKKLGEESNHQSRLSRGETGSGRTSRGVSYGTGQSQERSFSDKSFAVRTSARGLAPAYRQLWSDSEADPLPEHPSRLASPVLYSFRKSDRSSDGPAGADGADGADEHGENEAALIESGLPIYDWLDAVVSLLQHGCDWEVYSFVLVYLPSQLSNHAMFKGAIVQVRELRKVICELTKTQGFREPPSSTGLRRADVAICLFHALTMIMSYHEHFQKPEEDEIVNTFVQGMAAIERTAKPCIHALSICCYELPMSTSKALLTILQKMSQIITQPSVAIHVLEFLACLARRPSLYSNFREDDYRIVFGICFRYLQYVREKKQSSRVNTVGESITAGFGSYGQSEGQLHPNASDDLPQYVYALAYHVITFWFLALKLPDRTRHVGWIAKSLFTDVDGSEIAEEQAQITIDFMQRVAYADVSGSIADPLFTADRYGEINKKRWLIGNSIVTIEQARTSGWAQVTKRQPSGTSSYIIHETFHPPPAHQEHTSNEIMGRDGQLEHGDNVLPSHLLVQLLSSMPQCTDQARPIPLPDEETIDRALRVFDRISTVDGHKAGVIYIGEDQTDEVEILANVSGSREYVEFLNGLGTLTKLKGATFNTQGLDREYDSDGEFTVCWRDRVTEIVFHVTTQMPTNIKQDARCTLKKRHIGNDYVNIIFNDSGLPFKFDTFPSEFNFVNIVITPESRASFVATRQRAPMGVKESFYNVKVMSKPGFPEISPASETKIISLKALPDFVRLVALNASVFSQVWASRDGGEHISSWRSRLREINRLRERHANKPGLQSHGPSPSPPGTAFSGRALASALNAQGDLSRPGSTMRDSIGSLRRSSVATFFSNTSEPNTHSHRSSILSTAPTENTEVMPSSGCDTLVDKLDFSKWA